jgi:hypothetical protein
MQPAMPIGADAAGFGLAIENHPTAFAIAGLVEHIALRILTHLLALPPSVELRSNRLTIPPSHKAQQE